MSDLREMMKDKKRIVIKIGSSSLQHAGVRQNLPAAIASAAPDDISPFSLFGGLLHGQHADPASCLYHFMSLSLFDAYFILLHHMCIVNS